MMQFILQYGIQCIKRKELTVMKYQVEIIKRDVYIVEAETEEEARELVVNECGTLFKADEVTDIEVERAM